MKKLLSLFNWFGSEKGVSGNINVITDANKIINDYIIRVNSLKSKNKKRRK